MNIKIEHLVKHYEEEKVLNQITLEIEQVSTIGIIGASGCGKSTLLRMLSGIENPDLGEILINHCSPITEKKRFQEQIGYVFQKHNLFPHLTVRENLLLILQKIKKIDKQTAHSKVEEVLQLLQIEGTADKKPNEISGGQAQRASIARALSTDPEILFLDEPTAALDPLLTKEVLNAVKLLKNQGREFIFVTHEMNFLEEFADYIIFMDQGEIVEHGDKSIFDNPKTEELKEFLSHR